MDKLTGKTRFRPYVTELCVLLVLEVEYSELQTFAVIGLAVTVHKWRDATVQDLCAIQHLTYGNVHLTAHVVMPEESETVPPGDKGARKLH